MNSRRKQMRFSLRTACLLILVVSMFFGFYAFQARAIRQHHDAIRQLKLMGGKPVLMTPSGFITAELNPEDFQESFEQHGISQPPVSDSQVPTGVNGRVFKIDGVSGDTWECVNESFFDILLRRPSIGLAEVDLTNPDLGEDDIRTIVSQMQKIIALPMNETFGGIGINATGNGGFTTEVVETIRSKLPSCRFLAAEHLPNPTDHPIRIGMTTKQVEQAVAKRMYDPLTDGNGDPAPILKILGAIHETYQNADGTTSWTYTTDDVGVGTIVIDFGLNKRVTKISLNQGIPDRFRGTQVQQANTPNFSVEFN